MKQNKEAYVIPKDKVQPMIESIREDNDQNDKWAGNHVIRILGDQLVSETEYEIDEEGEFVLNEEGEKIVTKEAVYDADFLMIDVIWLGKTDHPYGWKQYSVDLTGEGLRPSAGFKYSENRF